jgi:hypothetical protein
MIRSMHSEGAVMLRLTSVLVLSFACTPLFGADAASHAVRYQVSIEGSHQSIELDTFDLAAERGKRRIIIVPVGAVADLPLLSIVRDAKGRPRPELSDPRERRLSDALLSWFEADASIPARWRSVETDGNERIRLPSLGLRTAIAVRRTCSTGEEGTSVLRLTLEEPTVQVGSLRVELLALDWRLELDEAGGFRKGELKRELIRTVGTVEQHDDTTITVEVLSDVELTVDEARAIAREFEALAPVARALLPGRPLEEITAARKSLVGHLAKGTEGRLAAAVPFLDARLAVRAEIAAGGSPDERAEKLIGKPAPEFTLTDLDGDEFTLSSLMGKPVLLSFWGYT